MAKIPFRVVGVNMDVSIQSYEPRESEAVQIDTGMQVTWPRVAFSAFSALFGRKLRRIAACKRGEPILSTYVGNIHKMGLDTVILSVNPLFISCFVTLLRANLGIDREIDSSGECAPPFPGNVYVLLRVMKTESTKNRSNEFAFRLILGHELEVEVAREWLPNQVWKSAKWFRRREPRGWYMDIKENFDNPFGVEVTDYGLAGACLRDGLGTVICEGMNEDVQG
jgi:hypothetical protein